MKIAKVTTNGRVSIPAKLRIKHELYPGSKVRFEIADDKLQIIPLSTAEEIRANVGTLELKGIMLKSLMEEKKRERKL